MSPFKCDCLPKYLVNLLTSILYFVERASNLSLILGRKKYHESWFKNIFVKTESCEGCAMSKVPAFLLYSNRTSLEGCWWLLAFARCLKVVSYLAAVIIFDRTYWLFAIFSSILWLGLEPVICHMALFEMVIINSVGALEVDMLQSLMRYCIGTLTWKYCWC